MKNQPFSKAMPLFNFFSFGTDRPFVAKLFMAIFILTVISFTCEAQTTYNFSTAASLSNAGGYYTTEATILVDGVSYKLSHLGNGNFTNQANGGNSNTASLKKDGSGGDFLKIERTDALPFQFYGLWLKQSSMNMPPYYGPPYYHIRYYDALGVEINSQTSSSSIQNETVTIVNNQKVKYVQITFSSLLFFIIDDLKAGPALASLPVVTTTAISQFTNSTALAGGNATSDGGANVTERGIVYGTSPNPTILNNKLAIGAGTGIFTQSITGLLASTNYYIRAYATNSIGTAYGNEANLITAAPFVLNQVHYFNTAWVSTTSQPTPFTKYVEGWSVTGASSGTGLISITRLTATTGISFAAEGAASLRITSSTTIENLLSASIKANDNGTFLLKSFKIKYTVKTLGSSFGKLKVTGYKNGLAVPGAVDSLLNIAEATAAAYQYSNFNVNSIPAFGNIDEFRITVENPVNSARLAAIDIDLLETAPASGTLPLTMGQFGVKLINNQALLQWKTLQETNTAFFVIEHSIDGSVFNEIATLVAAGNSILSTNYSFVHTKVAPGYNYYRIKMYDKDDKFTYSQLATLKGSGVASLQIYPNPVTNGHFFIASSPNPDNNPLHYTLYNYNGSITQQGIVKQTVQKVNIKKLPAGAYFIKLSNGQSAKLVKQ